MALAQTVCDSVGTSKCWQFRLRGPAFASEHHRRHHLFPFPFKSSSLVTDSLFLSSSFGLNVRCKKYCQLVSLCTLSWLSGLCLTVVYLSSMKSSQYSALRGALGEATNPIGTDTLSPPEVKPADIDDYDDFPGLSDDNETHISTHWSDDAPTSSPPPSSSPVITTPPDILDDGNCKANPGSVPLDSSALLCALKSLDCEGSGVLAFSARRTMQDILPKPVSSRHSLTNSAGTLQDRPYSGRLDGERPAQSFVGSNGSKQRDQSPHPSFSRIGKRKQELSDHSIKRRKLSQDSGRYRSISRQRTRSMSASNAPTSLFGAFGLRFANRPASLRKADSLKAELSPEEVEGTLNEVSSGRNGLSKHRLKPV